MAPYTRIWVQLGQEALDGPKALCERLRQYWKGSVGQACQTA